MKVIKKGTVISFSCGACNCEFVAGINVVNTPDNGENYYVCCPVCGTECHATVLNRREADKENNNIEPDEPTLDDWTKGE